MTKDEIIHQLIYLHKCAVTTRENFINQSGTLQEFERELCWLLYKPRDIYIGIFAQKVLAQLESESANDSNEEDDDRIVDLVISAAEKHYSRELEHWSIPSSSSAISNAMSGMYYEALRYFLTFLSSTKKY